MYEMKDYLRARDEIRSRIGEKSPDWLLVLGSGLGFLADEVAGAQVIPYRDIPGFAASTAPGHAGQLVFGTLMGRRVLVMQGRLHAYEGYAPEQIAFPVRTAKCLGARAMLITNAAGGINARFSPGELMLLSDHINPSQSSPLTGPNLPEFGERFCDMGDVYTKACRVLARDIAERIGVPVSEGVYCYARGPQFETPAEIRAFRSLGADAVGMSTVPESIAAHHAGMKILGITLITNMAAGMLDQPLSEKEVLDAANAARPRFSQLIRAFLAEADA